MRRTRLSPLAAVLLAPLLTPALAAQAPELVTDRPDRTESAVVVPRGLWQLESGWLYVRDDTGGVDVDRHEVPGSLLRVGLHDRLELRVGWSGYLSERVESGGAARRVEGAGDAEIGAKLALGREAGRRPETAVLMALSLPVGDDELSSDEVDPSVRLAAAHTLSERLDLGYNLGVGWSTVDDGAGGETTVADALYTVALGAELAGALGGFVELFGEVPLSAPGGSRHGLDAGVTYLVRENLQLDAAVGVGLSDDAEDLFTTVGVSWRWPDG